MSDPMRPRPLSELTEPWQALAHLALEARSRAHAPYSGFRVGAAVLAGDGQMYAGCNVENSSYGLTVCAERVALFHAVSEGAGSFQVLAVAGPEGTGKAITPCGACRQVILDLAGEIPVLLVIAPHQVVVIDSATLLPHAFGPEHLSRGPVDETKEPDK